MNHLTEDFLKSKIKDKEFCTHITSSGKILRWCILTMENGYAVTGKPSVCVDPIRDNQQIGEDVAFQNAFEELWQLEGYLLQETLNKNN
jgi:hypothetical protein